tara:strand:+ start:52 stop:204 length:153 start_codon:yes stop_codon:yes gene_type:complete
MDEVLEKIERNPYPCDDCGEIYDKSDLRHHFGDKFLVCIKCVELYQELYK